MAFRRPRPPGRGEGTADPDREDAETARHLRTTAAVPLLALAACASPATGPTPRAADVSLAAQAVVAALPEEDADSCTGAAGYRVAFPAAWATNADGVLPACSWFGPGAGVVVPEASDARTAPVALQVADAVELPGGDHERAVAVLDEMVQTLGPTAGI